MSSKKLPSTLKVDVYADVVTASDELIVAGSSSAPKLAAWTAARGAFVIDRPHIDGVPHRAAPKGLAALPGARFLMTWESFTTHTDQQVQSAAAVFDVDGNTVGTHVGIPGYELSACAAHGGLVAVAATSGQRGAIAIWSVEDLIAGRAPLHTFDGPIARALAFARDGSVVTFLTDGKLWRVPVDGRQATRVVVRVLSTATTISTSKTNLVCVSDGQSAAVVTDGGELVFVVPAPSNRASGNFFEHAVITPDGDAVIAAAGDLGKHFDKRYAQGVTFPVPEMEKGHVSVYDAKGRFEYFVPRIKNKPVRALALGSAVVIGQDGLAELVALPLAGTQREAATVPAGPTSIESIAARARAASVKLARGASERAIATAEKQLGVSLPDDVKAFYRRHDGATSNPAVAERELLSLARVVSEWKIWKKLHDEGTFVTNDHGEPGPGVQKRWWIPQWIPITHDGSGNHHMLDLAPGEGGTRGQIITFSHVDAARNVVATSLLDWLASAEWGDPDSVDEDHVA